MRAEHHDWKLIDLAGLNQRERLERLVERPEAAGEDDERTGVLHEHRLSDEEVPEVDECVDVRIGALFERQLDVAAYRAPAAHSSALVGRLHDPRAGTGHDGEAFECEQPRHLLGVHVLRILGVGSRGAEDRYTLLDAGERIEPLYELAHDPQHSPRIGASEIVGTRAGPQELLILRYRDIGANRLVDRNLRRPHLTRRIALRRRHASRRQVALFGPLTEKVA